MGKEQIITTPFKKSGTFLGDGARRIGRFVVPSSEAEQPAIIHEYEGRLGVATGLLEADDQETLEDRAAYTAHLMVDHHMVERGGEVELRPLAPEDASWEEDFTQDYVNASNALRANLVQDHGVHVANYSEPIRPTPHEDSPVDPAVVWRMVGRELRDSRRMSIRSRRLSVLAIAEKPYAQHLLRPQVDFEDSALDVSPLVVMQRAGEEPRQNILLPAEPPKQLEAGPQESTRLL